MAKKISRKKNKNYSKQWYATHRAYAIECTEKRRKKIRGLVLSYLASKPCAYCGEKIPECLEYHTNRAREIKINLMIRDAFSIDKITKALRKCTILCANCHKKVHAKREKSK